jgi:hypothetical protein
LDVASKGSFVYVIDRRGSRVESQEVITHRRFIRAFFKKYADKRIIVAVEAGGSTRWIYDLLTRMGIEVRRVGIQSAHAILHSKSIESLPLRKWWAGIAKRRGKKTALVALARKLVTIVFYVLRDKKAYDYTLLRTA